MEQQLKQWPPGKQDTLPELFRRIGWAGVWAQLVILAADSAFLFYALIVRGVSEGFGFRETVVIAGLVVMLVTIWVFYRYARFGQSLLFQTRVPKLGPVLSALWFGLWASVAGIVLSLVLLFSEVAQLVFRLLVAPQPGAAVAVGPGTQSFLSALDGVSLMASLIVLIVELVLVALTLWLLFRTSQFCAANGG